MRSFFDGDGMARARAALETAWCRLRGGERTAPAARAQVGGAADTLNDAFHDHYGRARDVARRDGPVFVLLADTLVVWRGARREEHAFAPRAFHLIKSITHVPVALFVVLEPLGDGPLDGAARARLAALRPHVATSLDELADEPALEPATRRDCRDLLEASLTFLDRLARDEMSASERESFANALGAPLLRLLRTATALQLAALHAQVEIALKSLSANERAALQVVVAGDHQARVRSLGMQYFRKRLREPEGSELRVTYGEGVDDEQSALALVGTRRLDRALARAFFGDEKRMQRDLLGDAARALLDGFDAPAIL